MKKTTLFASICLLFLFLLFFLNAEGQIRSKKRITAKAKKAKSQRDEAQKLREALLAQYKKAIEENKPSNLYVFVGEKVEVEPFQPEAEKGVIFMDAAFKAKYRIIQNLYGSYDKEVIEFEVYDHYGVPPFSKYKNVLLFVSEYNGKLYHEKYQYFDVYKTKDGNWASCGDPYRFDEYHRKPFRVIKLEFDEPLTFDLEKLSPAQIKKIYPAPFYKVSGGKAFCLMGAYIEDLFTVKKNGVLKARGLFK